jgi:hypothetical protein
MSPWHSLPAEVPEDLESVWVRTWWYSTPWLATWSESAATFTSTSGLVIPWYMVARWKHEVEP